MLELKNKQKLAHEANLFAKSFNLVRFRSTTYMPADYETRESDPLPPTERTMWVPLNQQALQRAAANQFDTLFSNEGELRSFDFMVAQNSQQHDGDPVSLLVKTKDGLRELEPDGTLQEPGGKFVPNTLVPMLNEDQACKDEVFRVISNWLDSEEEAHSLLHHFATALAPGWSAVKYVLLLGEGRNGKGLMLKMFQSVFGWENVSNVTRQQIADSSPVVCELNGKLLNLVFDGQAEYLKDSGNEKSLVAGEVIPIRRLYESTPTPVLTQALFVEGLNHEPKSKDKSSALQKRLIRYHFPNIYALDHRFERKMLAEDMVGALLSLLLDHYVLEDEVAEKLAPTQKALSLQLEHMFVNSIGLQFLKHLEEKSPLGVQDVVGKDVAELVQEFQSWRVQENDLGTWAEPDVLALFAPVLNTERRSKRENGKVRKVRFVTSLKQEAQAFIATLEGDDDDDTLAALVADGEVHD